MDIKQLKAAVQLAKLRVGSDPSDANKAKLEHAQNEYDNALNPEKKTATVETEDEPNPDKQPQPLKPAATKAAQAKPKTEPLENHPLKTTRTVVPISPEDPTEPQTPEPQTEEQPEPTEAK
ncbi:hypothetical protein [Dyadobacter sp. 22481]|uniref:hypothetical protein n=1 Tax=Dyadobacter sp. 22481 TaxID=3453926 RepID=UPI003F8615B5